MDSGPTISNLFNLQRYSGLQYLWTPWYLFKSLLVRAILLLVFQCVMSTFFRLKIDILHWAPLSQPLLLNSCPYGIPPSSGSEQSLFAPRIETFSRREDKPRRAGIWASQQMSPYFLHFELDTLGRDVWQKRRKNRGRTHRWSVRPGLSR
jgi:hypothetical protein